MCGTRSYSSTSIDRVRLHFQLRYKFYNERVDYGVEIVKLCVTQNTLQAVL